MSSNNKFLDEKSLKRLDRELSHVIDRIGLDRKTESEVFDKSTLSTLEKLISDDVISILDFPISTGKEGNIFRGLTSKKEFVAVKIYRVNTSTFKHITNYILGDPRFQSIHKNRRSLIYAWTKKEFRNLELLQNERILAPKPIKFINNVLVMQYLGDKNRPAPMLKDVKLEKPEETLNIILDYIKKMYNECRLVHADISSFNILIHKNKPYLIDLGQGVLLDHPDALNFLKRDISNIINYFRKYNIKKDADEIYRKLIY